MTDVYALRQPYYSDDQVTLHHGGCLDVLAAMPEASVDAVVTDPPYALSFMAKDWDSAHPDAEIWGQCLRVLKPGGHLLSFGGTRTWHRLACDIEDAGFELRDSIAWLYGSGFPKSLDVSKAIDRAAVRFNGDNPRPNQENNPAKLTAPATDAARQWQGWGTALKPAFEPVVVARKPLEGTVAANVQKHGVGALNVDACRVATTDALSFGSRHIGTANGIYGKQEPKGEGEQNPAGRWPTNVVLDEHQAAELDAQSGVLKTGGAIKAGTPRIAGNTNVYSEASGPKSTRDTTPDSGGASRFFPVFITQEQLCTETPKTTNSMNIAPGVDSEPGLTTSTTQKPGQSTTTTTITDTSTCFPTFKYTAKAPTKERPKVDGVAHPTVKPLALMRWLVKLVTPPGAVVLDPFTGSGTTLEAAVLEGVRAIGIEREADYLPLIEARLRLATQREVIGWMKHTSSAATASTSSGADSAVATRSTCCTGQSESAIRA